MKRLLTSTAFMVLSLTVAAFSAEAGVRQADNSDGTYTNPPLYADFPDPDIIRVGEDFYFATTTFVNAPGLTILHSRDLVSWEYVSHVLPRLDGNEAYDLKNGGDYRRGVYAPSLRYHNGVFYIAVTPVGLNTRIYTATDPKGPWSFYEIEYEAFDPGLFFDTDGKGYVFTSGSWDGTLTLLALSDDYRHVVSAKKVHYNKGAEGSKVIRRGDWYYIFHSVPFRLGLTVSRARALEGPWETRNQIDDTTGGHQGALVDLPDGTFYGFVMVDAGAIGRMTNISPIFWQDDWPVWGTVEAPGRVPEVAIKPITGQPTLTLATSDDFSAPALGLQWQWNHNPDDARWSLTERPGFMRLRASQASEFWLARNTLTQKTQGPWSTGVATLDLSHLKTGDHCGIGTLGKYNGLLEATRTASGGLMIGASLAEDQRDHRVFPPLAAPQPLAATSVKMRVELDFRTDKGRLSYSADGATWTYVGDTFPLAFDWQTGTFQGEQFALFCYADGPDGGYMDIDAFEFSGGR